MWLVWRLFQKPEVWILVINAREYLNTFWSPSQVLGERGGTPWTRQQLYAGRHPGWTWATIHQRLHLRSVSSHRVPELHVCRKSGNGSRNQEWAEPRRQHRPSVSPWNIKLNSLRTFAAISLRNRCSRLYVQSPHWIITVNSSAHLRLVLLSKILFISFSFRTHFDIILCSPIHFKLGSNKQRQWP